MKTSLLIGLLIVVGCDTNPAGLELNFDAEVAATGGVATVVTTGGVVRATGGVTPVTGGVVATGGSVPVTGGVVQATGGTVEVATGGIVPATGGAVEATGGSVPATGGTTPATGGVTATGGSLPATGGVVVRTGGVVQATGGTVTVSPDAGTPDTKISTDTLVSPDTTPAAEPCDKFNSICCKRTLPNDKVLQYCTDPSMACQPNGSTCRVCGGVGDPPCISCPLCYPLIYLCDKDLKVNSRGYCS